jgi:hypothetical protein
MDPSRVTEKFKYTSPLSEDLSPTSWKRVERLLQQTVKDTSDEVVRRLEASFHRASTETKLLRHENEGLRASLATKNKRRHHGKRLPLQKPERPSGGATFWSPRKVSEARARRAEMEATKQAEELKKVEMKELRAASKLYNKKIAEERRVERERVKVVKEKERAEKEAEKQRQKQERDYQKAIQTSQKGKRKALRVPVSKNKRQKRSGGGAAAAALVEAPSAPSPPKTLSGRSVRLPSKFR